MTDGSTGHLRGEVDPVSPAIQAVRDGIERNRDPLIALVPGHFVIEVARKQQHGHESGASVIH